MQGLTLAILNGSTFLQINPIYIFPPMANYPEGFIRIIILLLFSHLTDVLPCDGRVVIFLKLALSKGTHNYLDILNKHLDTLHLNKFTTH